ncbi:helix-turn-helix domain-containing protein [Clostridium thermobutyricum]|uniref:Helix-turn-helix domain protein n=1 Tax=Clostridium thermobutyricum DSM 4928 TaxID=1121339 RepID=A0A1V4SXY3_9CLOT|nr:helix-turn-helix domain-containing protein [Clostridium thermobutyricum]OPX48515.1 hypothetical protein CLTHE_11940 [Clostridium thermobutyricum DSM 4928]
MERERIRTEVKIEGIADQGYGLTYQYINRMVGLSPEAKTIYNYLSCLAGKTNEAFPSVKLMLHELGMSKTRFYKHRESLLELGLIRVEQGRFKYKNSNREYLDTCLYVLLTDYDKIAEQKDKYRLEKIKKETSKTKIDKINDVDKNVKQRHLKKSNNVETLENTNVDVCPQNEDTQNEDTQNEDTNNNNSKNNNSKNNNNNTTTIEKSENNDIKKIESKNSSSNKIKINLDLKNITKTNIKKLKLNQEQIDLLEEYVLNSDCDDIDGFSYFIAKSIKNGEITRDSLKISKSHKINKQVSSNNDVTLFRKTREKQLEDYNDAIEDDFNNLIL